MNRELEYSVFNYSPKILQLKKRDIRKNRYRGFIISDTYNNPVFPIKFPRFDENVFLFNNYMNRFIKNYAKSSVSFLPWHFFIEYTNNDYMVYNTRPFNYMFPLMSKECLDVIESNVFDNEVDTKIFNSLEMKDYIHIIILGDTTVDLYTKNIYFKIGKFIISAYRQYLYESTFLLNNGLHLMSIGDNFKPNLLINNVLT